MPSARSHSLPSVGTTALRLVGFRSMAGPVHSPPHNRYLKLWLCTLLAAGLMAGALAGAEEATLDAEIARLTRQTEEMRLRHEAAPQDATVALALARLTGELAEHIKSSPQRAALAEEGIAAAQAALTVCPTNAAALCMLGKNLGQLARTRSLGALRLVPQMEAAWLSAAALEPGVERASPHRLLAMLYSNAPGWPLSIGNRALSRTNFAQAVALAPEFPENWLVYFEACLSWEDYKTARSLTPGITNALRQIPKHFTGPDWAWRAQFWERRWQAGIKRLETAERRAINPTHRQRMKDD